MTYSEVERILFDDIREKKKAGSGAFHMRGKGVKHGISGALRTPSYFMKPKEKKNLNSEVRISNMYETILTRAEFEQKDFETQKAMFTRWREIYTSTKIQKEMGVSSPSYISKYLEKFGLPKKPRGGANKTKPREGKVKNVKVQEQLVAVMPEPVQAAPAPIRLITSGLHFEYSGEYEAEQINKILTKLQLLLDGEPSKFLINISISERV